MALKEITVLRNKGQYFLMASKYVFADYDATVGVYEKDKSVIIIAPSFSEAQVFLTQWLLKKGFYN